MTKQHTSRRSASQWEQEVRAWKQSGLTAAEYAECNGMQASTLRWWSWRLGVDAAATRGTSEGLRLVAVDVVEDAAVEVGSDSQQGWELRSAAGHVLRVTGPFTAAHADAVVSAMLDGGSAK